MFENFMHRDLETASAELLVGELELAGYPKADIEKALVWFSELSDEQPDVTNVNLESKNAVRVYHIVEKQKLGRRCLGYLTFMVQAQIITPQQRETILDRALAVEHKRIDIDQLKWITMMVLFHQADRPTEDSEAILWMQNLIFAEMPTGLAH